MPKIVRRPHVDRAEPAKPAVDADPVVKADAKPVRNDGFAPGAPVDRDRPSSPHAVKGPFAALAKRGDFTGYVTTASGTDVFVSIKLAKNPAANRPVVLLDGVAARYERNSAFEGLVAAKDQSIISIFLPGQGETLARDMEKGGRSLKSDIEQEAQAKVVIETLDALGVKEPVGVLGLSYGGAIAAQVEKQFPDRVAKVMLVAPFVRSQGKSSPMYDMMMNNPWNPLGPTMYRSAAKSTLERTFNHVPDVLKAHRGAFHEGLFRLSMGLEDYDLKDTVKGMREVHFLVVPEDGASDPNDNLAAFKGAATGSFAVAPDTDAGKHDLIRGDGNLVATWAADVMAGRWKAQDAGEAATKAERALNGGKR
ncbi:MAG: alpha/beta fold hydrolase [Myxococcaceae bacterium]|nr:alpha/beta fold hydrolase [Myxococcaceae bacterium]